MEHILQPGDSCLQCQRKGLGQKNLRYFYINLHEKVLKCESDECLYPLAEDEDDEDFCYSSEPNGNIVSKANCEAETFTELKNLTEDGLKAIEEFLTDTKLEESPAVTFNDMPSLLDMHGDVKYESSSQVPEAVKPLAISNSESEPESSNKHPRLTKVFHKVAKKSKNPSSNLVKRTSSSNSLIGKAETSKPVLKIKTETSSTCSALDRITKAVASRHSSGSIPKASLSASSSMQLPKARITRFQIAVKSQKKAMEKKQLAAAANAINSQNAGDKVITTSSGSKLRPLDLLQVLRK